MSCAENAEVTATKSRLSVPVVVVYHELRGIHLTEDHDECADRARFAQQSDGRVREHQARGDIGRQHSVGVCWECRSTLEGQGRKTHGGGTEPRDGEPGETADDVTGKGVDGRRCDCLVVVTFLSSWSAICLNNGRAGLEERLETHHCP